MNAISAWFRPILPAKHLRVVAFGWLLLLVLAILTGGASFWRLVPGDMSWFFNQRFDPMVVNLLVLLGYGILLGLGYPLYLNRRMFSRCPLLNPDYREWLMMTPWQPGRCPPMGTWHPMWKDGVVLVVATASILAFPIGRILFVTYPQQSLLWLFTVWGGGLLLGRLPAAVRLTRPDETLMPVFVYGVLASVALMILRVPPLWVWATFLAAVVIVLEAWLSLRTTRMEVKRTETHQRTKIEWPFPLLCAEKEFPPERTRVRIVAKWLTTAWCAHVVLTLILDHAGYARLTAVWFGYGIWSLILFVTRAGRYSSIEAFSAKAPVSLFGRIVRFRPLIWRYDRAFLPVLLALPPVAIMPLVLHFGYRLPVSVTVPLSILTVALILFLPGPSLRNWWTMGAFSCKVAPMSHDEG